MKHRHLTCQKQSSSRQLSVFLPLKITDLVLWGFFHSRKSLKFAWEFWVSKDSWWNCLQSPAILSKGTINCTHTGSLTKIKGKESSPQSGTPVLLMSCKDCRSSQSTYIPSKGACFTGSKAETELNTVKTPIFYVHSWILTECQVS